MMGITLTVDTAQRMGIHGLLRLLPVLVCVEELTQTASVSSTWAATQFSGNSEMIVLLYDGWRSQISELKLPDA